jgi:hypothetical protein
MEIVQFINMDCKLVENGRFIDNSNWIEEEDHLIHWSENLDFTKQPLFNIAMTFVYIDNERCTSGMLRTTIPLEIANGYYSLLNKDEFFNKVNIAKCPVGLLGDKDIPWLKKTYEFNDAAMYTIVHDNDHIDNIKKTTSFTPLVFSPDNAKILSSVSVFHDLYEIVVIMREVHSVEIKSILRVGSKIGKTKKVHISDETPTKYIYVKTHPVSGKRKTRRIR